MNDSLCESLSKSARVEPSPIAQPLSSAALAKLWLIFAASSDPPVIELTKNGALIFFPKKDVSRLISRSEEHTSELQSRFDLVCRLLLEKKKNQEPEPLEKG